jgi:hypothetical protein
MIVENGQISQCWTRTVMFGRHSQVEGILEFESHRGLFSEFWDGFEVVI